MKQQSPGSGWGILIAGAVAALLFFAGAAGAEQDRVAVLDRARNQALRAGIPAADVDAVIARAAERGINADATAELLGLATAARSDGLPARPLMNRIEQGLAKQAPQERIIAAVKRLTGHLASSRPVVDGLAGKGVRAGNAAEQDNAVETVARAFERSVPAEDISETAGRIVERRGTLSLFERAVGAITDMAEFGVPAESAAALVLQGLDRGYSEKDFDKMGRRLADSIRRGKSPEDAAKTLRDDLGKERRGDRRGGGRENGSERRGDMGRGGRER